MGDFFSPQEITPKAYQPGVGMGTTTDVLSQIMSTLGYNPGQKNINPLMSNPFSSLFSTPGKDGAPPMNTLDFMTQMAGGGGAATPVSALPAWQAMVDAQQRNLSSGAADLSSLFSTSGARFSSDFGNAATDYMTQARLGQNALLGQMQLPALLQSQQISANAGMQLPGTMLQGNQFGFNALMNQLGGLQGAATWTPQYYMPQYKPSGFSQLMGGIGSGLGMLSGFGGIGGIGKLLGIGGGAAAGAGSAGLAEAADGLSFI